MTAALLACFLAALLAEGSAISCIECRNTTAASCTGTVTKCDPASDVCLTKYTETTNTNAGTTTIEYIRMCGSSSTSCARVESMTTSWLKVRTNTTCCNADSCSSPLPTVPATDSTPNGQTCSTCVSLTSTYCYTTDTMKCTGIENKCAILGIKVSSASENSNIALRGCANPNLCNNTAFSATIAGRVTDLTMACSNSGIRLELGVLLPLLAGLLLLKLFS